MDFFPPLPDEQPALAASLLQALGVPARLTRAAGENHNYFVELADGRRVHGFLCEPHALIGATDVTAHGGWRAWLAHAKAVEAAPNPSPRP